MEQWKKTTEKRNEISWKLDENGIMTVIGAGKIPDCNCGKNPAAEWENVKNQIQELCISEGIREIGIRAFAGCRNLRRVTLPDSMERIYGYAFQDCISLVQVESTRDFRHVQDQEDPDKFEAVLFGTDSFRNTPWSRARWGDFYIRDNCLYTTFAESGSALIVPEGVRVLKAFSMSRLQLESLELPRTLEQIENFAFCGTVVTKPVRFPDSMELPEAYALADCAIQWTDNPRLIALCGEARKQAGPEKQRFPRTFRRYTLASVQSKTYGEFRKLVIRESTPGKPQDGILISRVMNEALSVGNTMLTRIRSGKLLLCVSWSDGRLYEATLYTWDKKGGQLMVSRLCPVMHGKDELKLRYEATSVLEKEDFLCEFPDENVQALREYGTLRLLPPGQQEEWFQLGDSNWWGPALQRDFMQTWLTQHPDVTVNSAEENLPKIEDRWLAGA